MRRTFLLASVTLLVAGAAASARVSAPAPAAVGTATFVITGHGWGHGVGLSQYGAYGYAQKGLDYTKILLHYFPGTEIGAAPVSKVRVLLAGGAKSLKLGSDQDFRVRDASGAVHTVAAGTYALTPGLKLTVDGGTKPTALTGPLVFQAGSAPLSLNRPYRGTIQVDVVNGKLRAINVVGLEQYLWGVVPAEMPFQWAAEALKAQAVAARSYALATRKAGAAFDLYPDTRSQMYLGVDHEKPSTTAAVNATAGQVVLYQGQVAKTYFFSTSGGRTMSAEDAWGTPVPYLVSVPDPYDTISPHHDWGPLTFTGAKLAKLLKLPGSVLDLQPDLNSSGRVKSLNVVGTKTTASIQATDLRRELGLRSTWFSVGVLSLSAPPRAVIFGNRARLNGVARGLTQTVLEQRQGADWQAVGSVKSGDAGAVSVVVKPSVTTQYRLASGKVSAAGVRVPVASLVRLLTPQTQTQLRGLVRPASVAGARVWIQRQQGAGWATVTQTTVASDGTFAVNLQLTSGVYRARVASGHGFVAGTSAVLQVSSS
ncbi:MAG TPA: SpoIID/LytB domain-containing protein [Gaiellaceae bacterium]